MLLALESRVAPLFENLDTRCRFGLLVELESDFDRSVPLRGLSPEDDIWPPLLDFRIPLRRIPFRDTAVPFELGEPLLDGDFLAAMSPSTSVGLSFDMFSFRIEK